MVKCPKSNIRQPRAAAGKDVRALEQPHTHSHEHTRAVTNRLARTIGHLEAVKKMVEDGRDCSEVLVQLAAVRSALNAVSRLILKDHIEHCVVDAVEQHDQAAIDELERAIDQLLK